MSSESLQINHSKPLSKRTQLYFCRLCREYNVKLRHNHLRIHHKVNIKTIERRANKDLIEVIFVAQSQ